MMKDRIEKNQKRTSQKNHKIYDRAADSLGNTLKTE